MAPPKKTISPSTSPSIPLEVEHVHFTRQLPPPILRSHVSTSTSDDSFTKKVSHISLQENGVLISLPNNPTLLVPLSQISLIIFKPEEKKE